MIQERMTSAEYRKRVTGATRKGWSAAIPTPCASGHRHPSKMEARVCERLTAECGLLGETLVRQVRLPLFALAPKSNGTAMYATVDFGIVRGGRLARLVDAKNPTRVSPEWARGAAAVQATYGITVEEVSR